VIVIDIYDLFRIENWELEESKIAKLYGWVVQYSVSQLELREKYNFNINESMHGNVIWKITKSNSWLTPKILKSNRNHCRIKILRV
jgi:hypothetical protein